MKKILLLVSLSIFVSNSVLAKQIDKWDAVNSIYQNFEYDFSWNLLDDISWIRQNTIQKGAVFAAKNMDLGIVVYVLAFKEDTFDVWEGVEEIKRGFLESFRNTGMSMAFTPSFVKCNFCGKHAVRIETAQYYENDDRVAYNGLLYTTTYIVVDRNIRYHISVMINQDVFEGLAEENVKAKDVFFNGWVFSAQ